MEKAIIASHKEPRMDTNEHEFLQSAEYTEETECLVDVGHRSEDVIGNT